jgi:hypothetical protein
MDRKLHTILCVDNLFPLSDNLFVCTKHRLKVESYDWPVNDGAATFGGSHIQFVDYDRSLFASFMSTDMPASDMVVGMGEMIEKVINLKGEPVGKRNGESETAIGAHYGNTGKFC